MDRKIVVLYVINDLGVGGAQRVVANIVCNLNRDVFTPIIFNLNYISNKEIENELLAKGVQVVNFHAWFLGDFRCIWPLVSFIKKRKIKIVHSHLCLANLYATIAARLAGIKCVISHEHNTTTFTTRPWYYRLAARIYLRLNSHSIAISQAVRSSILKLSPSLKDKITIVYNGIDTSVFSVDIANRDNRDYISTKRVFRVGTLVRNDPRKGFNVFETCAIRAKNKNLNVKFVAGVREVPDKTPENIEWYKLEEGPHGVAHYMSQLDVFVLPSFEEGLGLVAIEAMAMGKPVIASAVGGLLEVITHGKEGILVPAGDVDAIIKVIIQFKKNPDLGYNLGRAGKTKVGELFSLKNMCTGIQNIYLRDGVGF